MKNAIIKTLTAGLVAAGMSLTAPIFAEEFDAAGKYAMTCAACHASGVAGAPKTGDKAAWAGRVKASGLDGLVKSVQSGKGAMPPGGLCADCSEDQIKALINHMAK